MNVREQVLGCYTTDKVFIVKLNKYADINKPIIFKVHGKIFKNFTFTDNRNISITMEEIEKLIDNKTIESFWDLKTEIEYETAEYEINQEEYDSIKGLKKNITDLKSLDKINTMRNIARNKLDQELHEFVICGTLLLDSFGQISKLSYNDKREYFGDVEKFEVFKKKIKTFSYGNTQLPDQNSVCEHCGRKWMLKNIKDSIYDGADFYHIDCLKYDMYEHAKKEFDFILSSVFKKYSMNAISNEYGSEDYRGPWFIAETENGTIKIGWRKRVICIQWLENYEQFSFTGEKEDVTKHFSELSQERYIHAYTCKKAIEYLSSAKRSIIK